MYVARPMNDMNAIRLRRLNNDIKPQPEELDDFYDWFIHLHEYIHLLYLDWTPAKELARLVLSLCYDSITQLLNPYVPAEQAWKEFSEALSDMSQIEKNIGFVEELIATAVAMRAMERQILPGGMWIGFQEELETLKESALANEENNYSGFRAAYERIQPIIQLLFGEPVLVSYIVPLFQPVLKTENNIPLTCDAHAHLAAIFKLLDDVENVEEAYQRLEWLNEQEEEGWKLTLDTLIKWAREPVNEKDGIKHFYGLFARKLWNISKGNVKEHIVANSLLRATPTQMFQDVIASGSPLGGGSGILLQRDMYKTQPFLSVNYFGDNIEEEVRDDQLTLLFYEGIRQQLIAREGFICPYNKGLQRCNCKRIIQRHFLRLSHLALDGLFGPGNWSLPPCLVSRRR
jgi:hypothetical protein